MATHAAAAKLPTRSAPSVFATSPTALSDMVEDGVSRLKKVMCIGHQHHPNHCYPYCRLTYMGNCFNFAMALSFLRESTSAVVRQNMLEAEHMY